MTPNAPISRREFATQSALAAAALAASVSSVAAAPVNPWKIIAFSKPFDRSTPDETADIVAEIGWDGIECAVRAKAGHIAPDRVEEDLPKMVEALKKRREDRGNRHDGNHEDSIRSPRKSCAPAQSSASENTASAFQNTPRTSPLRMSCASRARR